MKNFYGLELLKNHFPSLSPTKRDINQVYPTTEPTHFLLLFCNSLPKIVLITSDVNSGVTMY